MTQIKVFMKDEVSIQNDVNEFIKDKEVVDIKVSDVISHWNGFNFIVMTVIYKVVDNN